MKSDGVKDVLKLIEKRCKELNKQIDDEKRGYDSWYSDDAYLRVLKVRLDECVALKISTEKYMKKLRYQGE